MKGCSTPMVLGVVFSPANNVASQGQPDFYVKGVPATTTVAELEVEQPRIYFGESADSVEYVVVNSLQDEVDYPLSTEGQSVAYTISGIILETVE